RPTSSRTWMTRAAPASSHCTRPGAWASHKRSARSWPRCPLTRGRSPTVPTSRSTEAPCHDELTQPGADDAQERRMPRTASRTVELHGQELSYTDSGSGAPVLFIHGLLGTQRQWRRLIDKIDDTQRVIVPDLFGHGESAKPMGDYSLGAHAATLRDLLDHLEIER